MDTDRENRLIIAGGALDRALKQITVERALDLAYGLDCMGGPFDPLLMPNPELTRYVIRGAISDRKTGEKFWSEIRITNKAAERASTLLIQDNFTLMGIALSEKMGGK